MRQRLKEYFSHITLLLNKNIKLNLNVCLVLTPLIYGDKIWNIWIYSRSFTRKLKKRGLNEKIKRKKKKIMIWSILSIVFIRDFLSLEDPNPRKFNQEEQNSRKKFSRITINLKNFVSSKFFYSRILLLEANIPRNWVLEVRGLWFDPRAS